MPFVLPPNLMDTLCDVLLSEVERLRAENRRLEDAHAQRDMQDVQAHAVALAAKCNDCGLPRSGSMFCPGESSVQKRSDGLARCNDCEAKRNLEECHRVGCDRGAVTGRKYCATHAPDGGP